MLDTPTTFYERIGGFETVDRLVDAFYRNMDNFPQAREIRAMHAEDLTATRAVLKTYLAEWLGGPKNYSAKKGHPRLRMRHGHLRIGPAERDAWLLCMNAALEEAIADADARGRIGEDLAKLADWMRNDPRNPHDQRHQPTAQARS
ncbi:MAG: group II truncated hemoglobin [Methylocystis sp.]